MLTGRGPFWAAIAVTVGWAGFGATILAGSFHEAWEPSCSLFEVGEPVVTGIGVALAVGGGLAVFGQLRWRLLSTRWRLLYAGLPLAATGWAAYAVLVAVTAPDQVASWFLAGSQSVTAWAALRHTRASARQVRAEIAAYSQREKEDRP